MVCISGGKDCYALLVLLAARRARRSASTWWRSTSTRVGRGIKRRIERGTCVERGSDYRMAHRIAEVVDEMLAADATPCSFCSRLRRGVLYGLAEVLGARRSRWGTTWTTWPRR